MEARDIPELTDADRPLPDSLRPVGAHLLPDEVQEAFYRGMRVGLEQAGGGPSEWVAWGVGAIYGFALGVILMLLVRLLLW